MSDTFSFKTARPARKSQISEEGIRAITASEPDDGAIVHSNGSVTRPKRKRRTRAEIEAQGSALTPTGELAVLKVCLKQLRSLDDQARARTLLLLKTVFE